CSARSWPPPVSAWPGEPGEHDGSAMNFELDETQTEIAGLAADVFGREATVARVEAVAATADRFDRELWAELARSGLLGVAVPEALGGLGLGTVDVSLVAEQLGRTVAPLPFVSTVTAGLLLAAHGSAEQQSAWLPRIASGKAVFAVAPRQ